MTPEPLNDFEQRLVEALHQEAGLAMTMTDTPRELHRWRDRQHNRRNRSRIIAAVAAAAAVAGLIVGVVLANEHTTPRVSPVKKPTPTAPRSSSLGALGALPASTHVSHIPGPVNIQGAISFGAVWATGSGATKSHLYRLDPATGAILGDTTYAGPVGDGIPPFRVGHVMLLPSLPAHGAHGYLVYAADGHPTGRVVPAADPGLGSGDATGGWVGLTPNTIGRVDADGRLVQQVKLSITQLTAIAMGPAGLWIGSIDSPDLLRLDPKTGATVARVHVDPNVTYSIQLLSTTAGVFDATSNYKILHVDSTDAVTAISTVGYGTKSYAYLTMGPDGNLWSQPDEGGIAVLNPDTLALVHGWQVFLNSRDGGVSGLVASPQRVFMGDIDRDRTVTFQTP